MQIAIKIIELLLLIPTIERIISGIYLFLDERYRGETKVQIEEAARLARSAKTKEDRLQAVKKWQEALSRARR